MPTSEALTRADAAGLDLVEIAPTADPPVCRSWITANSNTRNRKGQRGQEETACDAFKEIKMHPKTDEHDFMFKMEHARKFLLKGDRVKATVVFRGREITHIDFGKEVLDRLDDTLANSPRLR
jgi:translation initiation factor IF-3